MGKMLNTTGPERWAPDASFGTLKHELMKLDPVYFCEKYFELDGSPMTLTGNGWKFIADIYRHIVSVATAKDGRPIVIVKGRQVGATTMASALDLYFAASGVYGAGSPPVRVMHVFPRLELMYDFSKEKLEKMVRESAVISDYDDPKNPGRKRPYIESMKDSTRQSTWGLTFKQFKHGNVLRCDSIGNEGVRVRGKTADIIFFDEAQLMTQRAIEIANKTLTRAKYGREPGGVQVYFGTPEQVNTHFHRMWENSDQRRFYLGCMECGRNFLLYTPGSEKWKDIWLHDNIVRCPNCGCEQDKVEAIERGRWIGAPGKEDAPYVGFHFNQFFIPEFTKEVVLKEDPKHNDMKREVDWQNEVLGEFHSGEGLPITRELIYEKCRDANRKMPKSLKPGEKICYLGMDWGGKPDVDGVKRGQSYSCGVVLSVEHEGRLSIEFAHKLKKLDLESKIKFVENTSRLFSVRSAVGDIGYAEDISPELKMRMGERYRTARNSGYVAGGARYNEKEMEISIDKDKWIEEIFNLIKRGGLRFPWASYERVAWLIDHCCSMQSKTVVRYGMPHTTYIKGTTQNDGLMALMYAYVAYKFDQTNGFRTNPASSKARAESGKPLLAYLPRM